MSLSIAAPCVNCWACVDVCPNDAIVEAKPHFRIEAKRCTECEGDYAEPQCATICPIEAAILTAAGEALNPLGSLTGIPLHVLVQISTQAAPT